MGRKRDGGSKDAPQLVLVGDKGAKLRKASKRDWTKADEAAFLAALADTCNVKHAAEIAGVSWSNAYKKRRKDAAFRAAWREAIGTAYQRLELVLLERSLNGTEKIVTRKDGSEERMVEYSDQLGLALLKMHRATAAEANAEVAPADVAEIRERLLKKLKRMKARKTQRRSSCR